MAVVVRSLLSRAAERLRPQTLHRQRVLSGLFLVGALGLTFAPLGSHGGWPQNHEGLTWKFRTLIYAAHFENLDFFPIWSESAALGLGAPALVLYHKLFYVLSGALYLALGSVKIATIIALAVFSLVGVLGCRSLLRFLGAESGPALIASASLLFCNYSYTDWLVRGAFSEYSAMMLLPWLFRWLAGAVAMESERRLGQMGIWLFPSLYLAHSVLCFFALVPVAAVCCYRLVQSGERKKWLATLLASAGASLAVTIPIVACQLLVSDQVAFVEGVGVYQPKDFFAPLVNHLTGGQYVWGQTFEGYSVQLDVVLLAFATFALICHLTDQRRESGERAERPSSRLEEGATSAYAMLWLSLVYFGFLLSRYSQGVYAAIPGFSFLQFPWRLLSFFTVLVVCVAAFPLIVRVKWGSRSIGMPVATLLLILTYVSSPWMYEIRYPWIAREELEAPLLPTVMLNLGGAEYHPRVSGVAIADLASHLAQLEPEPSALQWSTESYHVSRVDTPQFEKGSRMYRVSARRPTTVIFPLAYARRIRVQRTSTDGGVELLRSYRSQTDPRIHIDVPAGDIDIEIRFPTLWRLIFQR